MPLGMHVSDPATDWFRCAPPSQNSCWFTPSDLVSPKGIQRVEKMDRLMESEGLIKYVHRLCLRAMYLMIALL